MDYKFSPGLIYLHPIRALRLKPHILNLKVRYAKLEVVA